MGNKCTDEWCWWRVGEPSDTAEGPFATREDALGMALDYLEEAMIAPVLYVDPTSYVITGAWLEDLFDRIDWDYSSADDDALYVRGSSEEQVRWLAELQELLCDWVREHVGCQIWYPAETRAERVRRDEP
ncbi:MAG: hypothetical protein PVJ64_00440 [Gemmatimonadales bacterium]